MAKAKRFWYEVVFQLDLGHWAPDQRPERWTYKGRVLVQPQRTKHSLRLFPSRGYNGRGEPFPPDYFVTDRPIGKSYTEEVNKMVSRSENIGLQGQYGKRSMRLKTSKIKARLLDADEVTESVRRAAYDLEWTDDLFENAVADVHLPAETARMAKEGAKVLAAGRVMAEE